MNRRKRVGTERELHIGKEGRSVSGSYRRREGLEEYKIPMFVLCLFNVTSKSVYIYI